MTEEIRYIANLQRQEEFDNKVTELEDELKRLERENKELQAYKDINENFKKAWYELNEKYKQLRSALEEIKKLNNDCADCDGIACGVCSNAEGKPNNSYKIANNTLGENNAYKQSEQEATEIIAELNQENKELRAEIESFMNGDYCADGCKKMNNAFRDAHTAIINENNKLRSALEEIKKLNNDCADCDGIACGVCSNAEGKPNNSYKIANNTLGENNAYKQSEQKATEIIAELNQENKELKEENVKLLFGKGALIKLCDNLTKIIDEKKEKESKLWQALKEIREIVRTDCKGCTAECDCDEDCTRYMIKNKINEVLDVSL